MDGYNRCSRLAEAPCSYSGSVSALNAMLGILSFGFCLRNREFRERSRFKLVIVYNLVLSFVSWSQQNVAL